MCNHMFQYHVIDISEIFIYIYIRYTIYTFVPLKERKTFRKDNQLILEFRFKTPQLDSLHFSATVRMFALSAWYRQGHPRKDNMFPGADRWYLIHKYSQIPKFVCPFSGCYSFNQGANRHCLDVSPEVGKLTCPASNYGCFCVFFAKLWWYIDDSLARNLRNNPFPLNRFDIGTLLFGSNSSSENMVPKMPFDGLSSCSQVIGNFERISYFQTHPYNIFHDIPN